MEIGTHRPRTSDGPGRRVCSTADWGTSKAYVIGLAFSPPVFPLFRIHPGGCALTGAGRLQLHHRLPAFPGWRRRLFLCPRAKPGAGRARVVAAAGGFIVTAAMSCWDAMSYFGVPREYLKRPPSAPFCSSLYQLFRAKTFGSFAITLAVPMVVVVMPSSS